MFAAFMGGPVMTATALSLAPANCLPEDSHFSEQDGVRFAGRHLLVDLWHASRLDDLPHIEAALKAAVEAVGATLLRIDLHRFSGNGGISGVAVLAESHMSIHSWPECGYAALDIFVCGDCDPYLALPVLKAAFAPGSMQVAEHRRGLLP